MGDSCDGMDVVVGVGWVMTKLGWMWWLGWECHGWGGMDKVFGVGWVMVMAGWT